MPRLEYFQDQSNPPPWLKALAEVRRLGPREGWCYQHVQAIMLSIDPYAESALGSRNFFLNNLAALARPGKAPTFRS
jgi:hypothetical protein